MAEGNRTTLAVAVAGIAATALVGLAGTGATWLSARDDRAAQRELARDERAYDRRVAVYLDAIDFLEGQKRSLRRFIWENEGKKTPFKLGPSARFNSRLIAFGSPRVISQFQRTEDVLRKMGLEDMALSESGEDYIVGLSPTFYQPDPGRYAFEIKPKWLKGYQEFGAAVVRFERAVHDQVG